MRCQYMVITIDYQALFIWCLDQCGGADVGAVAGCFERLGCYRSTGGERLHEAEGDHTSSTSLTHVMVAFWRAQVYSSYSTTCLYP